MKQKLCKMCGKKFKPKTIKQEDCSELCLSNRFDTRTRKSRALAKVFAMTMGYRSISEVRFAAQFKAHKIQFEYERHTFVYQYDPQKYTVDFTVKGPKGTDIHFEYKGKLDTVSRKKLCAIKKSNPKLDLRLVFEKPNNKLYKGAKMRYWEWAARHDFRWYDSRDMEQIIRGIKEVT